MSSVARRHHFLPQGYLAGFTDTGRKDGKLHVLDMKTRRSFHTSPLNVAVEKDFKRVDIEGKPIDAIENALASIEDQAIQAIRRLTELEAFPSNTDHNLILNLLSLALAQNPKSRRNVNRARTRETVERLESLVASQANWEQHVSLARNAGEELKGDLSYERARRFVEERRYTIAFDRGGVCARSSARKMNSCQHLASALGQFYSLRKRDRISSPLTIILPSDGARLSREPDLPNWKHRAVLPIEQDCRIHGDPRYCTSSSRQSYDQSDRNNELSSAAPS